MIGAACNAKPPDSKPPTPREITLAATVDRDRVSDGDSVTVTLRANVACDFVVALGQTKPTVLTRGSLEEERPSVVTIPARSLVVGNNRVAITAMAAHATVGRVEANIELVPPPDPAPLPGTVPASLSIETDPRGSGSPVTKLRLSVGQTVQLYAVTRDKDGIYVGTAAVMWSVPSELGVFSPGEGPATTFTATKAGVEAIVATHPALAPALTGEIEVFAVGVSVEDAPDGDGVPLSNVKVAAGQSLAAFAVLRGDDGAFLDNIVVAWSATNALGAFVPSNGSATMLTAANVSDVRTGVIEATAPAAGVGRSGSVRVVPVRVAIETQANGAGVPVGAASVIAGQTLPLHAIARDSDGAFVGNASVAWGVSGGIGAVAPTSGTSTTFTAKITTTPLTGAITATHATYGGGVTGAVSVLGVVLSVESAANGNGASVGARVLTPGDNVTLFAVARTTAGAFVQNASATWSVSNGAGTLSATNGTATTLTASAPGAEVVGKVTAVHAAFGQASSGNLTVRPNVVSIETLPNGAGVPLAAQTIVAGQRVTAYAVERTHTGAYVNNRSATWTLTNGALGSLSTTSGSSTQLSAGVSSMQQVGKLSATSPPLAPASSANLTLASTRLVIESAPDGQGATIGTLRLRMGQSVSLYAVGRASNGAFVGNAGASWSATNSLGAFAPSAGTSATTFTAANVSAVRTGTITATSATYGAGSTGQVSDVPTIVVIETAADGAGSPVPALTLLTGRTTPMFAVIRDGGDNTFIANAISAAWASDVGSFAPASGSATVFTATVGAAGSLFASQPPHRSATLAATVDWGTHNWRSRDTAMNASWSSGQSKATMASDHGLAMSLDFYEAPSSTSLAKLRDYAVYQPTQATMPLGTIVADDSACPADEASEAATVIYDVMQWWSFAGTAAAWSIGFVGKSALDRGTDTGETNVPSATGSVRDLVLHNQRQTNGDQGGPAVIELRAPITGTYAVRNLWARRMFSVPNDQRTAELLLYADPLATPLGAPLRTIIVGGGSEPGAWRGAADVTGIALTQGQRLYVVGARHDACSAVYDATQVTFDLEVARP